MTYFVVVDQIYVNWILWIIWHFPTKTPLFIRKDRAKELNLYPKKLKREQNKDIKEINKAKSELLKPVSQPFEANWQNWLTFGPNMQCEFKNQEKDKSSHCQASLEKTSEGHHARILKWKKFMYVSEGSVQFE